MLDDIAVEPMGPDLLAWRCLHGGAMTAEGLDRPPADPPLDWTALRARNVPLLEALTSAYGACAVLAREGPRVVGTLRFYPRAVWDAAGSTGFCLQQEFPCGPPADLARTPLPAPAELPDRTLAIHCLAVGRPGAADDPYRRRGLGTRMVDALVAWARPRGWRAIEADTYLDLPTLYAISGSAGRAFWEGVGFRAVRTGVQPELQGDGDFPRMLRAEAEARGIDPARVAEKFTMRRELP